MICLPVPVQAQADGAPICESGLVVCWDCELHNDLPHLTSHSLPLHGPVTVSLCPLSPPLTNCPRPSPVVLSPSYLTSPLAVTSQEAATSGISARERERRCVVLVSGCCDVRYWVQGVRCKVYVRLYLALPVWCVMVPGVRHTTDWPLPAALPTWDRPARRLAITRDDQSALLWILAIPGLSPLSSL